jgi:hypothetical protein
VVIRECKQLSLNGAWKKREEMRATPKYHLKNEERCSKVGMLEIKGK